MERRGTDPDHYLQSLPAEVRQDMVGLDALITGAMPGRSRVVWEGTFWGGTEQTIIGYGDLVQKRPGGTTVEWFVVGLARQKSYFSLYVNAAAGGRYLVADYVGRLGKAKVGSANVTFKRLADIDQKTMSELVSRADQLCPPDR
jgi:hypothetical protein